MVDGWMIDAKDGIGLDVAASNDVVNRHGNQVTTRSRVTSNKRANI